MDSIDYFFKEKFKRLQRRYQHHFRVQYGKSSDNGDRIIRRDNYTCVYCNREKSPRSLVVDIILNEETIEKYSLAHIVVESDGNRAATCKPCKKEKERKGIEEFLYCREERIGNLIVNGRFVCNKITEAAVKILTAYKKQKIGGEIKRSYD